METVTASVTIDRPRDEIFAYLLDIANLPEFTDHFLVDWRLTREDSFGRGAGARFRVDMRRNRFGWGDLTYVEVEPPRRIVAAGRGGKGNDTRMRSVFVADAGPAGTTRLTWAVETRPTTLGGRIAEGFLGQRRFYKRRIAKALKRLRSILEEGSDRGARATIAASGR
jgi:uncharacterized protein YndB with AHSA1/START domain